MARFGKQRLEQDWRDHTMKTSHTITVEVEWQEKIGLVRVEGVDNREDYVFFDQILVDVFGIHRPAPPIVPRFKVGDIIHRLTAADLARLQHLVARQEAMDMHPASGNTDPLPGNFYDWALLDDERRAM